MNLFAIKALAALAAVWLVIGGIIWLAREAQPTPDSIREYIGAHPLDGASAADRTAVLETVAKRVGGLDSEQRDALRKTGELEEFYTGLNPDEQAKFLDLTLPAGFQQMMQAFNDMPRDRRQRIVENALKEMRKNPDNRTERLDDEQARKVIDHGLRSYYSDASAETKLDLAPLIEQMQRNLQSR